VAKFAPAEIDFDDAALASWEKLVIAKLVEASDVIHGLFAEQVSPRNVEWRAQLAVWQGPGSDAAREYFEIMAGPWDRLEENEAFLAVGPKPEGAGYYPADLTREEFDAWLLAHPEDRESFSGYFTVIRRWADRLIAVPYAEAHRDGLERAAALLTEAAGLSQDASLSDYLRKRASAFSSNDYYESDVAWMDLASRIEPTIGPYEVYEDALLGYKAAFESFITVADSAASAELQALKDRLPALERALPFEEGYKNPARGFESPIRVVDEVYSAGDARAGIQTIAFNLPNDVRVVERKGSKKVMLRNVSRAKFDKILVPIARELLDVVLSGEIEFGPWFTNVLMHELAHGLGPGSIRLSSGEMTTVNLALREHHSALEETKADVVGLHSLTVLARAGVYSDAFVRRAFIGHLADLFRAVRFGAGEAHGRANLIEFNWLRERGAFRMDSVTARFVADLPAVVEANRALAREILTIQATGDYNRAAELVAGYAVGRPELDSALARLSSVPVDIRPVYAVLDRMRDWSAAGASR
jgi:hypothetical protein